MNHLHILTLSWNGADKLQKLHSTLIPSLTNVNYTWWIKDNGSKDNTVEIVKSWKDNIKLIPYKDNRQNFAEGMNYLFHQASPIDDDMIMMLNNDIVFNDTKSVNNMLSIINQDITVGVVGARLLYTDSNILQHAGVIFDPRYKTPMHYRARQPTDADAERNRLFQAVTAAVLITRASCYRQVCTTNKSGLGGMDEQFHWAFDDVDLCLAINYQQKKKIVYCGETNIFHEESATLKRNPTNKLFLNHNLSRLASKWQKTYVLDKDIYAHDSKHNLYRG